MHTERFSARHDRSPFDCGEPSLNEYLQRYASQNDARFLGRTYVTVFPDTACISGYYCIASGAIEREAIPDKKLPRYPIPVVRLTRLAVDKQAQGQRLGETLLLDVFQRCVQLSQHLGIYAIVVDALNDRARQFYLKYGFYEVQDDPLRLYLPMSDVSKLELRSTDADV
jgi:GNAT superfamily N-acetyltransferase